MFDSASDTATGDGMLATQNVKPFINKVKVSQDLVSTPKKDFSVSGTQIIKNDEDLVNISELPLIQPSEKRFKMMDTVSSMQKTHKNFLNDQSV